MGPALELDFCGVVGLKGRLTEEVEGGAVEEVDGEIDAEDDDPEVERD
jgi:hypothetical protein